MHSFPLFISAPKGMEDLLADELRQLGMDDAKPARSGAKGTGDLALAYRICLWSRLANRVLLPLTEFAAPDAEALYSGVHSIDWATHLAPEGSLAVDFHGTSPALRNTHFSALKVKDAVVDYCRDHHGSRPSVDTERPDLRLNAYLHQDTLTLSLDLSGSSLHRRGYRTDAGMAPMKENLAAAMLWKAEWPELAKQGGFLDPLCGAGTLPIEAALMAADIAPGLLHATDFGLLRWRQHDPQMWQTLLDEAEQRRADGLPRLPRIIGYDASTEAIRKAWDNAQRAGLDKHIHFERRALSELEALDDIALIAANPPYGERLGELNTLAPLYRKLGEGLQRYFPDRRATILTGSAELGKAMGLRADKVNTVYNGALECKLLRFTLSDAPPVARRAPAQSMAELSEGAQMFANRLRKNLRKLKTWAQREDISCYRIYDADLPEYNAAIDLYDQWVHVQEYAPPATIDADKAASRLRDLVSALPVVLEIPRANVFVKIRQRQKGSEQYSKYAHSGEFHEVREGPATLLVNFRDYLDTGLFLDHRPVRKLIRELAKGKQVLNLFCYTGSATVQAAYGGARGTMSVDLSQVYLDWLQRNLARNGFSDQQHRCERADCREWLSHNKRRYDLIFLDPPTFSNSKRMQGTLDIQRDHVELLRLTLKSLSPGGILIFSTNQRGFKLDSEALEDLHISALPSIDPDFQRNAKIHQCWKIEQDTPTTSPVWGEIRH